MKILIAGTPGVGKTTLLNKLSQKLNCKTFDISKFIIENKLYSDYDSEYDTYDFKIKNVRKALKVELKKYND